MTTRPDGPKARRRRADRRAASHRRLTRGRLAAALAALATTLVAVAVAVPACEPDDGQPAADQVFVQGPELENELGNIQEAFAPFEEATGISVVVTGSSDFEDTIGAAIESGNPPDIALFPQPGLLRDHADKVVPLPDDLADQVRDDFHRAGRLDHVTLEDELLAVPVSADLKSLVWYNPAEFRTGQYQEPRTLDQLEDLAELMKRHGRTPFCLGLESGVATGWPLTDWIEDYVLRKLGAEVYDAWVRHEIPFDHPDVVEVAEHVVELLARSGYVLDGLAGSVERSSADAGDPILDGDCMMYRMAHFQGRYWPAGAEVGPDGDVDAFFLPGETPGTETNPGPALTGGMYAAAFSDRRAVQATLEYIASPAFGEERITKGRGGFLSPHRDLGPELYESEIDSQAVDILARAEPLRYDGSDLMPGPVGSDALWKAMVDVVEGDVTVAQAFDAIEAGWPTTEQPTPTTAPP